MSNEQENAAPSSTEPSLLERAMDELHAVEQKIEHLIHPVAAEETQTNADIAPLEGESGNASAAVDNAATSTPSAASANSATSPAPNAPEVSADASLALSPSDSSQSQSAPFSPELGAVVDGGDAPNAAPAVAEQLATPPSALDASTPIGTSSIGASSLVEKLASGAASEIRTHIAAIKHHLAIRGFELSAVAAIHTELDAIEKLL
jgi:hypothetical protein